MQEFSILIISAVDFERNYKVKDLVTNDIYSGLLLRNLNRHHNFIQETDLQYSAKII